MAWSTHPSLPSAGECPAFTQDISPRAYEVVQIFRMQLDGVAEAIQKRKAAAGERAYTYLDPSNIARSTQI
jgi:hypothetical protein